MICSCRLVARTVIRQLCLDSMGRRDFEASFPSVPCCSFLIDVNMLCECELVALIMKESDLILFKDSRQLGRISMSVHRSLIASSSTAD